MLGTTLGNYRIERELGRGGMGAVFVGKHTLLGREAAIKVLLAKYSQDQDIVQRFFNEARAATRIEHPGIVEIYDFGKDASGCAYIVMELCQGESLATRIRRGHRMSIATVLTLARQIAGTLAAAHKIGIVHRDLKPDNVFVVPDPEVAGGERIKLLDFGIAKLATDSAGPSKTSTGVIMGTPNYMSPEQCRGAGQVDHRSDLYALGCMLFELLCRRVPFVGEGSGDVIGAHLLTPPPRPRSFAPDLPAEIEALILALLAKRPDDRPASADAVIAELTRLAAELPDDALVADAPATDVATSDTVASDRAAAAIEATALGTPRAPGAGAATVATGGPATAADASSAAAPIATTAIGLPDPGGAEHTPPMLRPSDVGPASAAPAPTAEVPASAPAPHASESEPAPPSTSGSTRVPAPTKRRWPVIALAGVLVIGGGVFVGARLRAPARPQLVIGQLRGEGMTDGIRAGLRPTLATLMSELAPELPISVDPDATGRFVLDLDLGSVDVDVATSLLRCKFQVTLSEDHQLRASSGAAASVALTSKALKHLDAAAIECVNAALQNQLQKQIVPYLRKQLGDAADPPARPAPSTPSAPSTPAPAPDAAPGDPARPTRYQIVGEPIELAPGASLPDATPPPAPDKPLDADSLRSTLRAYRPWMERCYLARLEVEPALATTVVLELDIDGDGHAWTLQAVDGDPLLGRCLAQLLARAEFPKPGDTHGVRFAIAFRPRR